MRRFLIAAFVAAFFVGYVIAGPGEGALSIAGALGVATVLTFTGWIVARSTAPRWGALAMTVFAGLMLIGR